MKNGQPITAAGRRLAVVLFFCLPLVGCIKKETILYQPFPAWLTEDCAHPELEGDTWRDLAIAYVNRGTALRECSARMRLLRN